MQETNQLVVERLREAVTVIDRVQQELVILRQHLVDDLESPIARGLPDGRYNAQDVLNAVCKYYSITASDIQGKSRVRAITIPRMVSAHLLRTHTPMTLTSIGMLLRRDHTTVMHMLRKNWDEMTRNPAHRACVEGLSKTLTHHETTKAEDDVEQLTKAYHERICRNL